MALFQKKPMIESTAPLYTLGLQKSLVIVGLGNIGKKYQGTRHNIGFEVIDRLAERLEFPDWIEKRDLKCLQTSKTIADSRIILIKPTTLMNLSGQALQAVQNFYKLHPDQLVVVHDELDIPFGQIRMRVGGSAAGNNGVQSIIDSVGEVNSQQIGRVRIGIKSDLSDKAEAKNFVLGKFTAGEQAQMPALIRETNAILSELIHGQPLTPDTRSFIV
jgi:peptidyl-tRNA hydrolase, PTH1 family